MNLQENHEPIDGNWWNPARPEIKWHGTLTREATKSAKLRVFEYGKSFLHSSFQTFGDIVKTLHGTSSVGQPITLCNSFREQLVRTQAAEECTFEVGQAIFGGHLKEEELTFNEVLAEFDYLRDWITYSRYEEKEIEEKPGQREIRIRLNPEYQFPFDAPGYSTAEFFLGYRSHSSLFEFSIENLSNLQLNFTQPTPLKDVISDLRTWRWFFMLATGRRTYLKRVALSESGSGERVANDLPVWLPSRGKREERRALHQFDMNFTLPEVRDQLTPLVTKWKEMQTGWAVVLHRYFSTVHREGLQLEERFLFRAQAIEALGRIKYGAHDMPHSNVYAAVWERAPGKLRERLGAKHEFVESVRLNRNYFVHYDPTDAARVSDFPQLFDLAQKLEVILEVAILNEIGVPDSAIDRVIDRSQRMKLVLTE